MKKLSTEQRDQVRNRILQAARSCYARKGARQTRMAEVAQQAGISRPLLYQYFPDRTSLIEACIDREFEDISSAFYKKMPANPTFTQSITESLIYAVKLVKARPWLVALFENIALSEYPGELIKKDRPFNKTLANWWLPVFSRAQETHELSRKIPIEDVIEWLLNITFMVLMRSDLSEKRQRYYLETFVIPALKD